MKKKHNTKQIDDKQDISNRNSNKMFNGESSKIKCDVPLIVEIPKIHDVSQIINKTFKDYLCCDLPDNERQLFDSLELNEHLSLIKNIRHAEKNVMKVQERLLEPENKRSLMPWNVKNYSLLPRVFGNYNANEVEEKNENTSMNSNKIVYGIHDELRQHRLRLNKEHPKTNMKHCVPKIVTQKHQILKVDEKMCLVVNTNNVVFNHFVPGGVYKKTVTVTNSGNQMVSFRICSVLKNSNEEFNYDVTHKYSLAPGMHSKLLITFKCTSMEDLYELLAIITKEDQKLPILIYTANKSPILKYIVEHYDKHITCEKSNRRCSSTISVFECNACLIGSSKTTKVVIKNIGRSTKFVCVPENVWYTKSVKDVEWKNSMNFDVFKITPTIFEINYGQSISLDIKFEPRLPSFYCSRFIMVSDNYCAREVNIFGDGEMFDGQQKIRLEGEGLESIAEKEGGYVLDMGKIGEVVRYVYVENTSRIEYSYRWIINHIIDIPRLKNAKVNFNIQPSTGLLDKLSKNMFRIECSVTDEIIKKQLMGKYRLTATMMINDIPKESMNDPRIISEEQEKRPELMSVKVAEIDIMAEYKGIECISLRIDPVIVDLNWYKLETDLCVEETVNFINNEQCPVYVSWIPDTDYDRVSIRLEPTSFEVVGHTTVSVRIVPKRTGRLREVLKFRTTNQNGHTDEAVLYIRGVVEPSLEVCVQPTVAVLGAICAGTPESYDIEFKVKSTGPFGVHGCLYEFDGIDTLNLGDDIMSFDSYDNGNTTLNFKVPFKTDATGILCQLSEWSFAGSKTVYAQIMTCVKLPDVHLNIKTITIDEPLYKGVSHSHKGIRLLNNTQCDFVYSWGNPMGSDANNMDCVLKPANGIVNGNSFVDFEFIVTPKTSGYFNKYYIPCFVQCGLLTPQQISVKCWVKGFSATITYVDTFDEQKNIIWEENKNQWMTNDNFVDTEEIENEYLESEHNATSIPKYLNNFGIENFEEYENESEIQKLTKWQKRETLQCSPIFYSVMEFKNMECNTAVEQCIIIKNNTKIPCHVKSEISYFHSIVNQKDNEEIGQFVSNKCCSIWIERNNEILNGQDELKVSIWALATTWGQYDDMVTIELHVNNNTLPVIHIPLIIQAITFPIEFPQATNIHEPTVKFSLFSANLEQRLQVLNNSKIPVQISWRIYNKNEQNRPFGVVFDTLTPDIPDPWSFRIDRYYGLELPRYFIVKPLILKLKPKGIGFVTFFLDRTKEISINRNANNIVQGKAIGTVTALESSEKHCIRKEGFKLKPTAVKLYSETRHSILPNLILRETDNIFKVSATQMYNSQSLCHTVTRLFTVLNLLRYPTNISFKVDSPFNIRNLRSLRCGTRPENASINVFYEDLIEIELEANIIKKNIPIPKIPSKLSSRKHVQTGHLYVTCENSYFKPKMIAPFEVHTYFPLLKLSSSNINFGQVVVRETKSIDVMLSSYPGPEHFVACSDNEVFTVSPVNGVASHIPVSLTITFRPNVNKEYSNNIEIFTSIPMDNLLLEVSGFGIK